MFIRRTSTRNRKTGEAYFTYRLVETVREGLAYIVVHTIRMRLKSKGINLSWEAIRNRLSTQVRITTTLQRRDGRTVHVRKASRPEPQQQQIVAALNLKPNPGGTQRTIV